MAEAIGAVHEALAWGVVGWHAVALVAGLVLLALDERRLAAATSDAPGGGSRIL